MAKEICMLQRSDKGKFFRRYFIKIEEAWNSPEKKRKLTPKAGKSEGLFEVKETKNDKTGWAGQQTLVTPRGRETFRLLMEGLKA